MIDLAQSKHDNSLNKTILKILIGIVAITVSFFLFMHFSPTSVQAAPTGKPLDVCQYLGGCNKSIENLRPSGDSPQAITKGVFDLILQFVGFAVYLSAAVAVGFIVFAGYKIISSQGDETKTKAGYQTLTNAVIGFILAVLAATIITLIQSFLLNFDITKTTTTALNLLFTQLL
jgi:Type IV secretion system pilin